MAADTKELRVLRKFIGVKLMDAMYSVFFHDDEFSDSKIFIWIGFEGFPLVQIRTSPSCEGVTLGDEAPIPYVMAGFGEVMIRCVPVSEPLGASVGKVLTDVSARISDINHDIDAICLIFDDGSTVALLGEGDSLSSTFV